MPQDVQEHMGWMHRVMDKVANILGGDQAYKLTKSPDGTTTVEPIPSADQGTGGKWGRIAAAALGGAAQGAANSKGPGGIANATAAGFQAGQQMPQQARQNLQNQADESNKAMMVKAQHAMLDQQLIAAQLNNQEAPKRAAREATNFALNMEQKMQDWGAEFVGNAKTPDDLRSMAAANPQALDAHTGKSDDILMPIHKDDGSTDIYRVPANTANQRTDKDLTYQIAKPDPNDNTKVVYQPFTEPAGSVTKGQQTLNVKAAILQNAKVEGEAGKNRATQTPKTGDEATIQSELAKTPNDRPGALARAAAKIQQNKINAKAAGRAATGTSKLTAANKNDPDIMQLGESVARGAMTEDQIPNFSQKKEAIEAYLAEHHPNLDQTSVFLTGAERKQKDLATNAIHNLDTIATTLQRRPDLIGKVYGRISQGKEAVGTDDADLGSIMTALDNYGLASTGAHGVKAVAARADAKRALINGFKNGPDGVAASMQAARMSLNNLASVGKPRGIDGSQYTYKAQPDGAAGQQQQSNPQGGTNQVPAGKIAARVNGQVVGYADDAKGTNYHAF
jgi:hypothetical protein